MKIFIIIIFYKMISLHFLGKQNILHTEYWQNILVNIWSANIANI